jgi:hypothetical protein
LSRQLLYPWAVHEHSAQSDVQNPNCMPEKVKKKKKKFVKEKMKREENL